MLSPQLFFAFLASSQKFLGMDALGWGMIVFLLLLLGIPYTREYLRRSKIPDWPITSARVGKVTISRGAPPEIPVPPTVIPETALIPFHCHATYAFLVDGKLYDGAFSLLAKTEAQAKDYADALRDQTILIKYNPRKPKDSILEERELLGTKAFQYGWSPINPKVW
jgi:hypothetical protein